MSNSEGIKTFEQWVKWLFDYPEGTPSGHLDYDDPWDDERYPQQTVEYIARLWSSPESALQGYSDNQIAKGLNEIVSCGGTGSLLAWFRKQVDETAKTALIDSVEPLYRRLFAPKCSDALGHVSEPLTRIEGMCYMFWDVSPLCPGMSEDYQSNELIVGLDTRLVSVLSRCLSIDNLCCQESILHGLGHGVSLSGHSASIQKVIDGYIASPIRDPRLREYAVLAREGNVL